MNRAPHSILHPRRKGGFCEANQAGATRQTSGSATSVSGVSCSHRLAAGLVAASWRDPAGDNPARTTPATSGLERSSRHGAE